jgi:hypothetical protein
MAVIQSPTGTKYKKKMMMMKAIARATISPTPLASIKSPARTGL